jgi:multidrug efflux pump subunit AcrA (membrane-fusion protein)
MKKSIVIILSSLCAILCTSCNESAAKSAEKTPENGAQFKKGEGLSLTDEMKKSIGFTVAEVGEEEIASSITLDFTATQSNEARGTVPSTSAIKPGMEISIDSIKGTVQSVEKIPFGMPGDLEVTVTTAGQLTPGSQLRGNVQIPASGAVAAVPVSALLKTAEGSFVYTVNGSFYVRSPVKTGAANNKFVEITDGLYSGDEIVTTPVISLWMAELQVLRGGKACTCGH